MGSWCGGKGQVGGVDRESKVVFPVGEISLLSLIRATRTELSQRLCTRFSLHQSKRRICCSRTLWAQGLS